MKTLQLRITFVTFLGMSVLCSTFVSAQGGGSVSGGADSRPDLQALFTSVDLNQAVKICVQGASDFGFSQSQLEKITGNAFNTWAAYYIRTGGKLRSEEESQWKACTINGKLRKGFRIATEFQILKACDGTQDLAVYFGVDNELTRAGRSTFYNPFAFTELLKPLLRGQLQDAWSPGFIWIAPPGSVEPDFSVPLWTNYGGAALELALTHEMGHVFGTDHTKGTVMKEDLSRLLSEYTQVAVKGRAREDFPGSLKIDQNRFLTFVPELAYQIPLTLPIERCERDNESCLERNRPYYQFVYQRLTGYALRAYDFEASLVKPGRTVPSWDETSEMLTKTLPSRLDLKADGVVQHFTFEPISSESESLHSTFREGCREAPHKQINIFGLLKNEYGTTKQVSLKFNWGLSKVSIVDPTLPSTDDYCRWQSRNQTACVLLSFDSTK